MCIVMSYYRHPVSGNDAESEDLPLLFLHIPVGS